MVAIIMLEAMILWNFETWLSRFPSAVLAGYKGFAVLDSALSGFRVANGTPCGAERRGWER